MRPADPGSRVGSKTCGGTFTFTVQIRDSSGLPAEGQLSLTINPASLPNAFRTESATAGQVDAFAAQSIVAAYGSNLSAAEATAVPLPTILDGTTVTV